jgi:hypothetical protein
MKGSARGPQIEKSFPFHFRFRENEGVMAQSRNSMFSPGNLVELMRIELTASRVRFRRFGRAWSRKRIRKPFQRPPFRGPSPTGNGNAKTALASLWRNGARGGDPALVADVFATWAASAAPAPRSRPKGDEVGSAGGAR